LVRDLGFNPNRKNGTIQLKNLIFNEIVPYLEK